MDKLSDIIKKDSIAGGYANLSKPAWICHVAGKILGSGGLVKSFRDGKLTINASDYVTASIFKMQKKDLIRKINQKLKSPDIEDIKIVVETNRL